MRSANGVIGSDPIIAIALIQITQKAVFIQMKAVFAGTAFFGSVCAALKLFFSYSVSANTGFSFDTKIVLQKEATVARKALVQGFSFFS